MSVRGFGTFLSAISIILLLPVSASAGQWPRERDGIMLGVSLGAGSGGVTVANFDSDRESGFGGGGRVGYAINPEWVLGLEGDVWTKEVAGQTCTFSVGGPAVTLIDYGYGKINDDLSLNYINTTVGLNWYF